MAHRIPHPGPDGDRAGPPRRGRWPGGPARVLRLARGNPAARLPLPRAHRLLHADARTRRTDPGRDRVRARRWCAQRPCASGCPAAAGSASCRASSIPPRPTAERAGDGAPTRAPSDSRATTRQPLRRRAAAGRPALRRRSPAVRVGAGRAAVPPRRRLGAIECLDKARRRRVHRRRLRPRSSRREHMAFALDNALLYDETRRALEKDVLLEVGARDRAPLELRRGARGDLRLAARRWWTTTRRRSTWSTARRTRRSSWWRAAATRAGSDEAFGCSSRPGHRRLGGEDRRAGDRARRAPRPALRRGAPVDPQRAGGAARSARAAPSACSTSRATTTTPTTTATSSC